MNIIFDLDGTLIDSSRDIIECLTIAYKKVFPNRTFSLRKNLIGPPVQEMIKILSPTIEDKDFQSLILEFRILYDSSTFSKTKLCPGVQMLLKTISQPPFRLFIVTNKPILPTKKILQKFTLNIFEDIMTPDTIPGKKLEKSTLVQTLIEKYHLSKNQTCMVGDSESDVVAARANQITSIALLNGYGKKTEIMKSKPDYCIKRIELLLRILGYDRKS